MTIDRSLEDKLFSAKAAGEDLQSICHGLAKLSGWWTNMKTGEDTTLQAPYQAQREEIAFNVPEKLMLIVSEVAEGMEGYRKNKMDDALLSRTMLEVELADTVIRCFDLAGGLKLDLGGAIAEKLAFNQRRADHKLETRKADGGKAF